MCMFENSHAEICDGEPEGDNYIISRLESTPSEFFSTTEIVRDGMKYSGDASVVVPQRSDEEEVRRLASRAVKTSFYKAALALLPEPPAWGALTGVRPSKVAGKYIEAGLSPEEAEKGLREDYFVSEDRSRLAVTAALRAKSCMLGYRFVHQDANTVHS